LLLRHPRSTTACAQAANTMVHQKNQAFTLIELLVVIAIIAILAAILFPVFAQAKASAKKASDLSNVKQIATAQVLYVQDYDGAVAMNRSCNLWREPNGPANASPCQAGDVALGWIDFLEPYTKSIDIFKSPGDSRARVSLPSGPGNLCYHWEREAGGACTARPGSLRGFLWGNRVTDGVYRPIGGDFRSSFGRNNNFANNGVITTNESQIQWVSSTIMIAPHQANTGAGANGNEGISGSIYNINRKNGKTRSEVPACTQMVTEFSQSQGNNEVSFVHNSGGAAQLALETPDTASGRFSGGANYAMVDTSARNAPPSRVYGQCNWGPGRTPEFGANGQFLDFRL
jgi:prepilin-type N-terminal cleavage/methylation domain-containing protein